MSDYIYSIAGAIYAFGIKIMSFFSPKVKLIYDGRKRSIDIIKEKIDKNKPLAWFHVSSLGEFEQARPLIEHIKSNHSNYQILVSFFSPSGYEIRKNYNLADAIVYLPNDTLGQMNRFINAANPDLVFVVKYDFWPIMLSILKRKGIKTYLVSAIFRKEQLFFKSYGWWYCDLIKSFDKIFVQDENSKKLLDSIGVNNTIISGDTRFDRVISIANNPKKIEAIEEMKKEGEILMVFGSSWQDDESIYIPYLNNNKEIKAVIAPHEIDESHLLHIESLAQRKTARLSDVMNGKIKYSYDYLLVDCIGLLSSIYKYADIGYIGGGFGKGIHNSLEAAVYGMPIIFGPNNKKFREAQSLKEKGAAIEIHNYEDFAKIVNELSINDVKRLKMAKNAFDYVRSESEAVRKIFTEINL